MIPDSQHKEDGMIFRDCLEPQMPEKPFPFNLFKRKSRFDEGPKYAWKWEDLSVSQRYERALIRPFIMEEIYEENKPDFENKAFDFYGQYGRINPEQKFKYAETKTTMFYRDLCDEMIERNESLLAEIDIMIDMNNNYRFNEK